MAAMENDLNLKKLLMFSRLDAMNSKIPGILMWIGFLSEFHLICLFLFLRNNVAVFGLRLTVIYEGYCFQSVRYYVNSCSRGDIFKLVWIFCLAKLICSF